MNKIHNLLKKSDFYFLDTQTFKAFHLKTCQLKKKINLTLITLCITQLPYIFFVLETY